MPIYRVVMEPLTPEEAKRFLDRCFRGIPWREVVRAYDAAAEERVGTK